MCDKVVENNCRTYSPIAKIETNCHSCNYFTGTKCKLEGQFELLFDLLDRGNAFIGRMIQVGLVDEIAKIVLETIAKADKPASTDNIDWPNAAVVWTVKDEEGNEGYFLWDTDVVELKDADGELLQELTAWFQLQPIHIHKDGELFDKALSGYHDPDKTPMEINKQVFPIPQDE